MTSSDELYTWGEGKFGRLGHSTESNSHTPRLVEALLGKKPKQVSCGGFHTAVVSENGHLYTFGGGEHGQLGHNDRVNKLKPTLVQALEGVEVSQITCGWSHSVALTAKGRVYTWGNSDHGKLGHGSGRKVSVPQLVEKLKDYRVVRVASYNEHTAALVEPFDHTLGLAGAVNAVAVSPAYTGQIRALVNDDEFSDVTFLIENQPVYAHRAILAQRCEHFAAMFRRFVSPRRWVSPLQFVWKSDISPYFFPFLSFLPSAECEKAWNERFPSLTFRGMSSCSCLNTFTPTL